MQQSRDQGTISCHVSPTTLQQTPLNVSEYYSPRMILHHENIDYAKHCAIPFGTYMQEAAQENTPSNTQESCSLNCIYLHYLSNQQGGHELLHDLGTGSVIMCWNVTPIPLTQHVIDLVHAMAERDGMPNGLKIENKAGLVLYDSSRTAGVDYDDDEEYQDDPMVLKINQTMKKITIGWIPMKLQLS
jgi:hypothetical protein